MCGDLKVRLILKKRDLSVMANEIQPDSAKSMSSYIDSQELSAKLPLTVDKIHNFGFGMELMQKLQTMEVRNKELEAALEIKESTIQKMRDLNENLQKQIRNKDTMRLSQLELLAMRNVELEMKIFRMQHQRVKEI